MPNTATQESSSSFINKTQLLKIKKKAMRAGVWYRALPRIDRVLIDLTIKVANNIRSATLARCIRMVIRRLEKKLGFSLSQALRMIGLPLAHKIGLVAEKWGNGSAKTWVLDSSFLRFLAVTYINGSKNFGKKLFRKLIWC
jgi:hypothetical protein